MAPANLGKYELRGELGRGAAGTVYDAWDPIINRRVAIKTVRLPNANDEEAQEELGRFRREAQAAGNLNHPSIVHIHDYGETGEIAYIVMEYVGGGSLKDVLDKTGQVPAADAVRYMDELLAGLEFSHERGIVHRDIKPANIMLDDKKRVKIADFGIARIEGSSATMVGTMLGTPAYMSPEQWRGDAHIDARSDIYASGVLLYHLLTGVRPFEGSQQAIMHKVFNEDPKPPSDVSIQAPPELDRVVLKAIARRAEDRYASAADFAAALKSAMTGGGGGDEDRTVVQSARRPTPAAAPARAATQAATAKPAAKSAGSKTGLIIAAVVSVVVLVGAGGAFLLLGDSKPPMIAADRQAEATRAAAAKAAADKLAADQAAAGRVAADQRAAQDAEAARQVAAAKLAADQLAAQQRPVTPTAPPPVIVAPVTPIAPVIPVAPVTPVAPPAVIPPAVIATPTAPTLRDVIASLPCTAVYGDSTATRLTLRGVMPQDHVATLRASFERTAAQSRTWDVIAIPPLDFYCQAIEALRPFLRTMGDARGIAARLLPSAKTKSLRLLDYDPIDFDIDGPDFAGNLYVDSIGSDGKVSYYMPRKAEPNIQVRRLKANDHIRLFDNLKTPGAQIGPPFGTDLVVLVASSEPLQMPREPEDGEQVTTYIAKLRTALDTARRRGARVSVELVPIESVEK